MAEIIVLDRHEVPVAVLSTEAPGACPFWDDTHTERMEDGFATYEFSVPLDHEDALKIEARGYVLFRDLDGFFQLFRIETVEDRLESDGTRIRRVIAESAVTELNNDIVRPMTLTGATATQALDTVLSGTRWQRGIVEWLGSRTIELLDYPTVLAAVHKIKSEFGAEVRFRVEYDGGRIVGRYVDLLQQRGQVTGKRFEYQKDLSGAVRTEDTTQLVTAMIGLGKADDQGNRLTFVGVEWKKANGDPVDKPLGQDWVGDPDALQTWGHNGKHVFGVFEDAEEEDPKRLLQKTWDELQNRINGRYTYEVEVATLERVAGYEHEAVRLGDTVTVHDYAHEQPLVLEARVIELQRSYTNPTKDKVVLGRYRPLLTSLPKVVAELQATVRRKQALWESDQIHKAPMPPDNPSDGKLWLNTSVTPNVLMRYDAHAGTWVKATPTQASEVGAETPEGAKEKADAAESNAKQHADQKAAEAEQNAKNYANQKAAEAEQNAKAYTDQVAERKIARGTSAPSNPKKDDIWIDTSTTPPVWRRWNGSTWEKMTRTQFSELAGQITGTQIAPDAIEPQHIAWLDASLITAGTMLADRIRGGTLELGGLNNQSGVMVLKDENSNDVVLQDKNGVTIVTDDNRTNPSMYNSFQNDLVAYGLQFGSLQFESPYVGNRLAAIHTRKSGGRGIPELSIVCGAPVYDIQTDQPSGQDADFVVYGKPQYDSMFRGFSYDELFRIHGDGSGVTITGTLSAGTVSSDTIKGQSNADVIYLGTTGPSVDMAGGSARWRQSDTNYIRQRTDGVVEIVIGGATRHLFRADGTKSGGTIEIDGKIYGMSPVDSPRVLITDVLFDVQVSDTETVVNLDRTFAKTINGYAVFPNRGDVQVISKTSTSFVVIGPPGGATVDFLVIGKRVGYEDTYWMPIETPPETPSETEESSDTSETTETPSE